MSQDRTWDDAARNALRDSLRWRILGELRLALRDHEGILQTCREVYLQDQCPDAEWDEFERFANNEIDLIAARLADEHATWPAETDCNRLDRVEDALRQRGILLWQASPCCDSCTRGEVGDRIDVIDRRYPGFSSSIRGCAFFIDQNLPDMLAESTALAVYLGYGWLSQDGSSVDPDDYEQNALGIAREVCQCLLDEGFEPNWDGSYARKIGISLNWQRRTLLR